MICGHSTGTMTGCRPLCDAAATHVVGYYNGSLRIRSYRCEAHIRATSNAAYPSPVTVAWISPREVTR